MFYCNYELLNKDMSNINFLQSVKILDLIYKIHNYHTTNFKIELMFVNNYTYKSLNFLT